MTDRSYPLRISQTQLTLLVTCPRQFQHRILDQLGTPETTEHQERLRQGEQFHLLLQQWLLGLPAEVMVQADQPLQQWLQTFQQASAAILMPGSQYPESDRTLEFGDYLLMVRYDLLILGDRAARILDWKTYPRPKQVRWLESHWQTRLYPFVLAETSPYPPDAISMVYWFFETATDTAAEPVQQAPDRARAPQSLTLAYNHRQHEATRQDLTRVLAQLTNWLQAYQIGTPFPQVPLGSSACDRCPFAVRCERASFNRLDAAEEEATTSKDPSDRPTETIPTLADIAEIPL